MAFRWDFNTSVEEVMNGLNNLVQQGKVLYLVAFLSYFYGSQFVSLISYLQGISDAPAWIVSKVNILVV
jgi:aryl-alcohol dehydrogenase-like predicted oxidoreductase